MTRITGKADVYLGVVDDGIDISHPDLAANMWTNSGTNWPKQVRVAPLVTTNRGSVMYGNILVVGPSFGLYNPGANSGMNLAMWQAGPGESTPGMDSVPLPSTVHTGDWLRLKLTVDFNML